MEEYMANFDDFMKLDIRVGEITKAEVFEKAKKPAYKIWVDFGNELGVKKTSAQITECYEIEQLIGKQVLGVVNFPPKQVANFISEFLVLGVYSDQGVVLIQPDQKVNKGDKLG
jgi:tRNA-binding protein